MRRSRLFRDQRSSQRKEPVVNRAAVRASLGLSDLGMPGQCAVPAHALKIVCTVGSQRTRTVGADDPIHRSRRDHQWTVEMNNVLMVHPNHHRRSRAHVPDRLRSEGSMVRKNADGTSDRGIDRSPLLDTHGCLRDSALDSAASSVGVSSFVEVTTPVSASI